MERQASERQPERGPWIDARHGAQVVGVADAVERALQGVRDAALEDGEQAGRCADNDRKGDEPELAGPQPPAKRIFLSAERGRGGGPAMRTVASNDRFFSAQHWWQTREGQKSVFFEWAKTVATVFGL